MSIDIAQYDQELAVAGGVLDTAVKSFREARDSGVSDVDNTMGLFLVLQDLYAADVLASVLVAAVRRMA